MRRSKAGVRKGKSFTVETGPFNSTQRVTSSVALPLAAPTSQIVYMTLLRGGVGGMALRHFVEVLLLVILSTLLGVWGGHLATSR